jgi:N-methylhydantoinase A
VTSAPFSLGVDIGGTFTDLVLYNHERGQVFSHKELTTPQDPAQGVMTGIKILLNRENISGGQIFRVVHATTLFTNALIERKGVKTGLITTAGFRDTLEMRREHKYDLYDLFIELPRPLIPREYRHEADERVLFDGKVDIPLNSESILTAGAKLTAEGIQAVAICFLHSYINAEHEIEARRILKNHFPDLYVSISSEVCPQIREYERTSTTAANAYVQPIADQYLASMEVELKELKINCPLLMMLSNGGLTHVNEARKFPVQLLESGPAAGAIAAAYFSQRSGISDVLAFDMGGTTAKLSIVESNKPLIAYSFEAGREKRFAQGSGLPINVSAVELIEIGAGGGSIAHIDSIGLLKVGPLSAGSQPGPACYGRGGSLPTVTDANLLLGHLNGDSFAGGTMILHRVAAIESIAPLQAQISLDEDRVSRGILDIVNENMAAAARVHVAERGFSAPHFSLLITGGGGPLHGCEVARRLGIKRIICPPGAGVASALGLLIAPARVDRVSTLARRLSATSIGDLEALYVKLEEEASAVIKETLPHGSKFRLERRADIRFYGQGFELIIDLPEGPFDSNTPSLIADAFAISYTKIFGQVPPVQEIELINLRVSAIEDKVNRHLSLELGNQKWKATQSKRELSIGSICERVITPVLTREEMSDTEFTGPLIIEDASSTFIIPRNARAWCDPVGNLIVELDD